MGLRDRLREKILSRNCDQRVDVEGDTVVVRELGLGEIREIQQIMQEVKEEEGEVDDQLWLVYLLTFCCETEEGEVIFDIDDAELLLETSPSIFKRLQDAALKANAATLKMGGDEGEPEEETGEVESKEEGNGEDALDPPKKRSRSHRKKRKRSQA